MSLFDPIEAAFRILRGEKRKLDLMKLVQDNVTMYSFQSIHWGLGSEIGARNSWTNFLRIAYNLRCYSGKIEYLLPSIEGPMTFCSMKKDCVQCSTFQAEDGKWETIEGELITVLGCNLQRISQDICAAPFSHLADGLIDLVIIESCTRAQLLNLNSSLEDGSFVNSPQFNLNSNNTFKYLRVKAFRLSPAEQSSKFTVDGDSLSSLEPIEVSSCRGVL